MDSDRESSVRTPVWRDPLSVGWRAHRNLLMLRLRWHERAQTRPLVKVRGSRGPR
ncbi:hypothetical protein [Mycobacterium sp. URHB0021]